MSFSKFSDINLTSCSILFVVFIHKGIRLPQTQTSTTIWSRINIYTTNSFRVDIAAGLGFEIVVNDFNGTLYCDRSSGKSDICVMKGDVRTDSASYSITLYTSNDNRNETLIIRHEKIQPYTIRLGTTSSKAKVSELDLIVKLNSNTTPRCDVHHTVPALVFSTGGYTGNLYHDFNNGILPIYITSEHMNKRVIFVILDYHEWWLNKYGDILSQLSDFPVIDFEHDPSVHCFSEAIIGLTIHGPLTIDASLMQNNKTIFDLHDLIDRAYLPHQIIEDEKRRSSSDSSKKPKLVLISRKGSRAITNEDSLLKLAADMGFIVEVLRPNLDTKLITIYRILSLSNVVVGVHGAAMTHFFFMRPKSVLIQVIPIGIEWPAETCFGRPARMYGLKYIPYKILPNESSLIEKYDENDPILVHPNSINSKGWEYTFEIYLKQNVTLNLPQFREQLLHAYNYSQKMMKPQGADKVI